MLPSCFCGALLVCLATAQFQMFLSRPDITGAVQVQILNKTDDPSSLDEGYFFLAPYLSDYAAASYGPQIIDGNGELVWYGNETIFRRAMDFHVCDYRGSIGEHLCMHDATPIQQGGHSSGLIRFFDNTYAEVDRYNGSNGLIPPDIHELNTPNGQGGGMFIQDVFETVPADLSAFSGPDPGYALSGCFQDTRLDNREVIFQWCSLDHVPLDDTYLYIPQAAGRNHNLITGDGSINAPWDYFHINAIAKNFEGDYLVSSRHTDTIFKIAGLRSTTGHTPGTIIWRLGGKHNDFAMLDNLTFSRQHSVRFHATTSTTTELSLFDNASDGKLTTAPTSSGLWLTLSNTTMTAALTHRYAAPSPGLSTPSQGQLQSLPNTNILLGWGARPYFSEFTRSGTLLLHAHFGAPDAPYMQSYRAWKHPWRAAPTTAPALFVYARNCSAAPVTAYASWNGATEVARWRFYASGAGAQGPWTRLPEVARAGFETRAALGDGTGARAVYAEALGEDGGVLGTTGLVGVFVPAAGVAGNCSVEACGVGFRYVGENEEGCGWEGGGAQRVEPGVAAVYAEAIGHGG